MRGRPVVHVQYKVNTRCMEFLFLLLLLFTVPLISLALPAIVGVVLAPLMAISALVDARQDRTVAREHLKLGVLTVSSLLERAAANKILGRMKVMAMLESVTAGDKAEAREVMVELAIGPDYRLNGLDETQRWSLVSRFG